MVEGRFIGVDVGGTKVAAGSMHRGRLGDTHVVPTDISSTDALLDQVCEAVGELRTEDTRAVGIGVPSVVEFATGRIAYSVNIPLTDVPLRSLLTDRLGLPVFVENDASCAALAEAYEDEDLVASDLVMLTVGTGVGGGLVLGGRLYRGATGAAAEMGHLVIGLDLTDGAPRTGDDFPRPGTVEALSAGTELDRLAMRFAREHPDSSLGRCLDRDGTVTGRDAAEAAQAGDPAAARALHLLGERLGIAVANAINCFDPAEVVIGGGVSAAGDLLLTPVREVAQRFVLTGVGTATTIRLARRGVEAGVVGAALIAAQEHAEEQRGGPPPPPLQVP